MEEGSDKAIKVHIEQAMTRGFYGIDPGLMSQDGEEILENEKKGNFCTRNPWPGICRAIHNDPQRYTDTYFTTFPGMINRLGYNITAWLRFT